jgi:hypothetical protein
MKCLWKGQKEMPAQNAAGILVSIHRCLSEGQTAGSQCPMLKPALRINGDDESRMSASSRMKSTIKSTVPATRADPAPFRLRIVIDDSSAVPL